jgi:hypothetical protein
MEEPGQDRMLRRVIALLVLLAGIAERAAGRALPVRLLVLLVLRRAESVARAYVASVLVVDVVCYEDDGDIADGPPGAEALALRLRALAAALVTLLEPPGVLDAWARTAKAARRRSLARHAAALVGPAAAKPRPHDTS